MSNKKYNQNHVGISFLDLNIVIFYELFLQREYFCTYFGFPKYDRIFPNYLMIKKIYDFF